jgi:hypothetical protein
MLLHLLASTQMEIMKPIRYIGSSFVLNNKILNTNLHQTSGIVMLPKKVSAKTFTYLLCTEHWWVEHDLLLQKWNLIKRDGSFHDSLFLERVVSASWPCRPNRVWPVCLTSGQLQILKAELLEAAENGWWMSRERDRQRKRTHICTCMGRLTERKTEKIDTLRNVHGQTDMLTKTD